MRDQLLVVSRALVAAQVGLTREQLRNCVVQFAELNAFKSLTAGDIDSVVAQLETEILVTLGPAHTIKADYRPWLDARKHIIDFKYWKRYSEYLTNTGFPRDVVRRLDEVTDRILDLAGDPEEGGTWSRRGLVVGHVQSGKTANYLGFINKAADAGYKLIVLIAGVHNNLRSQTQERVDQGFVGRDSDQLLGRAANAQLIGVGQLNRSFSAVAFTSRTYDFNKHKADGLGVPIHNLSQPAIFVVKKNKSILTNLIKWLEGTSMSGDKLTMPILVIDDEADNASINTAEDPNDPGAINRLIRELLASSTRNTYVGYTATPFANIFIDPDSDHDLLKEDLFPRDFIVGLDAPSNYVGAADYFLAEDGEPSLTISIEDEEDWLPLKHPISIQVDGISGSLQRAIDCFVIAKAVRILRGQGQKHHSMLVNVSRFTGVQEQVAARIDDYLTSLKSSIEVRYLLPMADALRDPGIRSIYETWGEHYEDSIKESWAEIQKTLHEAAASTKVIQVNARSPASALDYRKYSATGLNVIAVGGNSLSRGFTLEGLTISYFLRNTQMYDTLLQMGRWFGYREGYKDVCRLFISAEASDWYAYIADATEELRREIAKMEANGLKPIDFGLAVRSHPGALLVTARNKMRSAQTIARQVGLANRLVESSLIYATGAVVRNNWECVCRLIAKLNKSSFPRASFQTREGSGAQSIVFSSVSPELIVGFMGEFSLPPGRPDMSREPLIEYVEKRSFPQWDVLVASSATAKDQESIEGLIVGLQVRAASRKGERGSSYLAISKNKMRVASRGQEAAGLSPSVRDKIRGDWKSIPGNQTKSVPDSEYRQARSRPLLMLHLLDVKVEGKGEEAVSERHAAYGVSFPGLGPGQEEVRVLYRANVIAFREIYGSPDDAGDEDDLIDE